MRSLQVRLVLAAVLCTVATAALGQTEEPEKAPVYVTSQTCIDCHRAAGKDWATSHHAQAWNEPTERRVHGDFDSKTFEHRGIVNLFSEDGGQFFVTTQGPDGQPRKFKVVGTVGVVPLQQYLVETEPGRQQALDTAWDKQKERWYQLYPDQDLPPGDGLHWTGPYKNWNSRCAECHATGYEKNYAPQTRRYSSTQAEIGVGCEACHGPGSAHVAWAKDRGSFEASAWHGVKDHGFTIGFNRQSPETEIQLCAGCHSRREPFGDASPLPGTAFHDSYRLALLRDGLYHADGQIRDEVYVYGSFLQSRMYARGVGCTNCHSPHSGALKAQGNAVCTQCHNPSGNPDFPTLKQTEYDSQEHHFHEPGSDGAQCRNCHMIERVYMGIDARRDHSFRIPRPDLSVSLGTPNACTDCHADKSAAWASEAVAAQFPDSSSRGGHYATSFAAARQGSDDAAVVTSLIEIALSAEPAGIVRATALDLLQRYATPEIARQTTGLLQEPDALVRAAAIPLQRAAAPSLRVERLGALLEDERRSVRIEAARALLDILAGGGAPALGRSAGPAIEDYQRSLAAKADFPETQLAIAGMALVFRNYPMADRAFSEAVAMDPQRVEAWVMIARIRAALGDSQGAAQALAAGLAANPNDANLTQGLDELLGSRRPN